MKILLIMIVFILTSCEWQDIQGYSSKLDYEHRLRERRKAKIAAELAEAKRKEAASVIIEELRIRDSIEYINWWEKRKAEFEVEKAKTNYLYKFIRKVDEDSLWYFYYRNINDIELLYFNYVNEIDSAIS